MTDTIAFHILQPKRSVNIAQRSRYSLYKDDLRADFFNSCGYCDTLDFYHGGKKGFHIDHFVPKKKYSHLTNDYNNLIYCCPTCNLGKSDDWPSGDPLISFIGNSGYIDPCSTEYYIHLSRAADGHIIFNTELGQYIYNRLKLYLKRRQICWLLEKMELQLTALAKIIDEDSHPEEHELLASHYKLSKEYLSYIGSLKRD